MIKIAVSAVAPISTALGTRKLEAELPEDSDVLGLLLSLSDKYGDEFRGFMFDENGEYKSAHNYILLNGRNIMAYSGVSCRLSDGDEVVIMPTIAGG